MTWTKWNTIALLVAFGITMPIWFYIMHWLIWSNNPDRLIKFLFWLYLGGTVFAQIIVEIAKSQGESK